jgi:hypothetical protein
MNGQSYDAPCPNCGGDLSCNSDNKPFDQVSGECLHCGFMYWTKTNYHDLETLNELRAEADMELLDKLPEQDEEYKDIAIHISKDAKKDLTAIHTDACELQFDFNELSMEDIEKCIPLIQVRIDNIIRFVSKYVSGKDSTKDL